MVCRHSNEEQNNRPNRLVYFDIIAFYGKRPLWGMIVLKNCIIEYATVINYLECAAMYIYNYGEKYKILVSVSVIWF